ncbi:MAG: hypothetical protein CMD92_05610 [Gammaproteobacteria bacterium]|nr:hypothetical protein [Gammaproteobacteria bacterium]
MVAMEKINTADDSVLRRAAMEFLARREHSAHELETKLNRKFSAVSPTQVLNVLSRLTAEGLQSDERYTESRIRYRQERGFGYHNIRTDLISKGVRPILIDQVLHPEDDCWVSKARELVKNRLSPAEENNIARIRFGSPEHIKLMRFLESRGFARRDIGIALEGILIT